MKSTTLLNLEFAEQISNLGQTTSHPTRTGAVMILALIWRVVAAVRTLPGVFGVIHEFTLFGVVTLDLGYWNLGRHSWRQASEEIFREVAEKTANQGFFCHRQEATVSGSD